MIIAASRHHPLYSPEFRRLPHLNLPGRTQVVTFRLVDSLPGELLERWRIELAGLPKNLVTARRRKLVDEHLDRGFGACWLARPEIAALVRDALRERDGDWYDLDRWVLMPNHAHVIFSQRLVRLSAVIRQWKGATARAANLLLGRTDEFWARDYFDRAIRDDRHLANARAYCEANPVNAGLVAKSGEWPWGSWACRDESRSPIG